MNLKQLFSNHYFVRLALALVLLGGFVPGAAPVAADPLPGNIPTTAQTLDFSAIAAGGEHTCALTGTGGVKCWGANGYGQLGDGTTIQRSVPVEVNGLSFGVTAITAGGSHTCALTTGGGVKCWGRNEYGQLGDGTTENRMTPVEVSGLSSGVTAIAAGGSHTCALTDGGGVKCWGYNVFGQLGDGTTIQRSVPVEVSGLSSGVSAIAAGGHHTCALISSGDVKCWGANWYGQLGDGTTENRTTPVEVSGLSSAVSAIAAGKYHTCALTDGGGVKCWGDNEYGQLGDGTTDDRLTPVDVSGLASGVSAIAVGVVHTCALISSGDVKCWGDNYYGQLGDGTTEYRTTPVEVSEMSSAVSAIAAGGEHTCALTTGGGVKCWGRNYSGELGDGTIIRRSVAVEVSGLSSAVSAIAAGFDHTCALTTGGGVKCWGDNYYGQLGDGTIIQRSVLVEVSGLSSGVTAIAAGEYHTCALTDGGGVKCWGYNYRGQLGDGTYDSRMTPVDVSGLSSGISAIAAGGWHTCALTTGGGVKCWGYNWYGQLGDGTNYSRITPVEVSGLSSGVTAIAAGGGHTCALTDGGGVKCWGGNYYGQLGDGTTENRTTPVDVSGLSPGVTAIAAGGVHTCALTDGGGVKCWGDNEYGQLGDGTTENRMTPVEVSGLSSAVTAIAAGYYHSCALTTGGGVKCWGDNYRGQLGDGTTEYRTTPVDVSGLASRVSAIAVGEYHTCALTANGRAKCWGSDSDGQLGVGTILYHTTPVDLGGPSLTLNYPTAQPGSYFTLSGWNFPADTQGSLTINGQVITTALAINPTGSFIVFLNTAGAEAGSYVVTVSVNPEAMTGFLLTEDAPLRPQEGGGQEYVVPGGVAYHDFIFIHLPLVVR
jgi:alpha-tubulin suppressor-like RCC1 family protein